MKRVLGIGSSTVGIEWDDDRVSGFAPYLFKPWEIGDTEPEYLFRIVTDDNSFFVEMPDRITECPDECVVALEIEYALTMLAQKILGDHVQVHGSAFGTASGCVLIVGTHGIGKTTLALTAISRGLMALSDDICPIDRDHAHLLGFPRPFKATDVTWDMSPRPVPDDCPFFRAVEDITYVFFHEPPGKYYAERLPLRHIILPVRREGATVLEPSGETEAMQLMLSQGFNYTARDSMTLARDLIELLRLAPPFHLYYENACDAVDSIRELLG